MRKRRGLRAQQHTYNAITRDIQRSALNARIAELEKALRLCVTEIEQFHHRAYPGCTGGCPAHEALDAARGALRERNAVQ